MLKSSNASYRMNDPIYEITLKTQKKNVIKKENHL